MDNRNKELAPGYNKTTKSSVKGKRLFNTTSLLKKEAAPQDTYYVTLPQLSQNQVIIPDTMALVFKFKNSNTKSWFKNNLGRQLVEGLRVTMNGEVLFDNTGESILETYKDLWLNDEKRASMLEYGIANQTIRKILSKDYSAATGGDNADDLVLAANQEVLKLKLGKILEGRGPYAPYNMGDFEYRIKLPKAENIMGAQSDESVGSYKLTDINLEYETIEGNKIAKETKQQYEMGRDLCFDYTTVLKTLEWDKNSTRELIDVSIPRRSMKAIVILCQKKNATESEEYVNFNVESVKVTIEGNPNSVYSQGLAKSDVYDEARRFFGSRVNQCTDNLTKLQFLKNKYALVIDFRTIDEENIVKSGRRLVGAQAGVLLEITKKATTENLMAHIFVVAHGHVVVQNRNLQAVEY